MDSCGKKCGKLGDESWFLTIYEVIPLTETKYMEPDVRVQIRSSTEKVGRTSSEDVHILLPRTCVRHLTWRQRGTELANQTTLNRETLF